ncbi:hypothetical protein GSI_10845 [Ganoderma sinense ZZ0214-1]|uniref:Uncharacterized protein n=1 Tax=Ganoderma sinense ZZ0214-1 TaxID=1077348 RepID=A0A2G8S1Q2_9APHY|nr:hypothetical protein GSI_10845 [Ganoderma sinense ZZ0214-1]
MPDFVEGNGVAGNSVTKGHVPLDVDGYPVAPAELELQQVHIYVRHGERTPVGVRMAGPPANIPENWMFCNIARQFRAAVASWVNVYWVNSRTRGESGLRKLYVDRLKFLPDVVRSNDEIYLRSTNIPRTIESLQQIIHGLYPVSKSATDFMPHLRIRNGKDENLFGNTMACKRLEILQVGFAQGSV